MMPMKEKKYQQLVQRLTPKENIIKDMLLAFLMGGALGMGAEYLYHLWGANNNAKTLVILIYIVVAGIATGLGWFDKLVCIFKTGLLVPITGFSHAMVAAAMEHKKEGLVTGIGVNIFKLTGTVILYGVVGASICGTILYLMR